METLYYITVVNAVIGLPMLFVFIGLSLSVSLSPVNTHEEWKKKHILSRIYLWINIALFILIFSPALILKVLTNV